MDKTRMTRMRQINAERSAPTCGVRIIRILFTGAM
jgi:hypothetical protein